MNHFKYLTLSLTGSMPNVATKNVHYAILSTTCWLILPQNMNIHLHTVGMFTCVRLSLIALTHNLRKLGNMLNAMADYAVDYHEEELLIYPNRCEQTRN